MDEKDFIYVLFTLLFNADTNMKNGQSQVTFDELDFEKKYRDIGAVKSSYYEGEKTTCDLCKDCYKAFKNWMVEVFAFDKMMSELEKGRSLENESRKKEKARNDESTS